MLLPLFPLIAAGFGLVTAVVAVPPMPPMVKQMHQGAGEQQEKGQVAEQGQQVRAMLGNQEIPADRQETDQRPVGSPASVAVAVCILFIVHGVLPR
jgi:hypothetical protein